MIEGLISVSLPMVFYVLPFLLAIICWQLWIHYIRAKYISATGWILLEIKIPKEVMKTPQAMEVALGGLHQTWDGDNKLLEWFRGQLRTWFSLELVSFGGEIHFYLRTSKFHRNIVEAQFYAQYPEIEIVEVEDYVNRVPYGLPGSDWRLWGAEFKLAKEDAYPIKTYVDYGLDKPSADRESDAWRTDPLTAMLEFFGSVGPGEHIWIQILVQAAKDRFPKKGAWFFGKQSWKDEGKALVEKLMQRGRKAAAPEEVVGLVVLSPGERRAVEDIERSLAKPGFDCGIRALYLTKENLFNPNRIVALVGSFKQYNAADKNGFKAARITGVKYPFLADPLGRRVPRLKAIMFDAYRERSYFYPPYARRPFVLSAEELATIYHFPGRMAQTPSLGKIESRRAEPPVNLPV